MAVAGIGAIPQGGHAADSLAEEVLRAASHPSEVRGPMLRDIAARAVRQRDERAVAAAVATAAELRDERLLGDLLLEQGFLCFALGDNEGAFREYRNAGDSFRSVGDPAGQALAKLREAEVFLRSTRMEMVEKLLREVETGVGSLADPRVEGEYFRLLEYLAFIRGDHSKAVEYAERAISVYRIAGSHTGLSQVYRVLGDLYGRELDLERCRTNYELAVVEGKAGGEPVFLGRALWGMGVVEFRSRSFEKALAALAEAREVFSAARYPVGIGDVANWEGDIFRLVGDPERARAKYQDSFTSYSAAGSRVGMGNSLLGQGIIQHNAKEWSKALELYQRAHDQYYASGWLIGLANVTYWRGVAEQEMGDLDAALSTFERALDFCRKIGDVLGEADITLRRGEISQHRGDPGKARELYAEAKERYERLGAHDALSLAQFRLAGLAWKDGRFDDAAAAYEESIRQAELVRSRAGLDTLKRTFMNKVIDRYEEATLFMLDRKRPERAFTLAEGMKARAFLDQLAEAAVDVSSGVDPDLKFRRDRLEARREQVAERVRRGMSTKAGAAENTRGQEELSEIDRQLDELRRAIRLKNPVYGGIQYPEPVSVREVQNVLWKDELLVEYLLAGDAAYRFVIGRETFEVVRMAMSRRDLERIVTGVLVFFTGENNEGLREGPIAVELFSERLADMYQEMFGDLREKAAKKRLVIVPDGILARFPFEMLVARRSPLGFAIQLHDIRYIQSATVLVTLRSVPRKPSADNSFIGFGDPVYDYERFKAKQPERGTPGSSGGGRGIARGGYQRAGGILNRLEGSGKEVQEIAARFSAANSASRPLLRDLAREEAAKNPAMAGYTYIHFSTHGILDHQFQALALTQDPDSPQDGFLTLGELMNPRYNARLVVLSACETGLGREERGEGVTGFTRGVMYAGSPAVVVSLWKVDDEQTRFLMTEFYDRMIGKGVSPSAALRQAKLALLDSGDGLTAHPFSWAPFVLYGE